MAICPAGLFRDRQSRHPRVSRQRFARRVGCLGGIRGKHASNRQHSAERVGAGGPPVQAPQRVGAGVPPVQAPERVGAGVPVQAPERVGAGVPPVQPPPPGLGFALVLRPINHSRDTNSFPAITYRSRISAAFLMPTRLVINTRRTRYPSSAIQRSESALVRFLPLSRSRVIPKASAS